MTQRVASIKPELKAPLLAALLAVSASASVAEGDNEFDPADLAPSRFTVERFAQFSDAQVYDIVIAVRRGRTIRIDGCSVSQSRAILRGANADRNGAIQQARAACG